MGLRNSDAIRKILILSPSLHAVGGVQTYTRQLIEGFSNVLKPGAVRVVAVGAEPSDRSDGSAALPAAAKLRFVGAAARAALTRRPDVIVCMHIGLAPAARMIRAISGIPYWLVLHGIEVWDALSRAKLRALREADRYVVLSRFTLNTTSKRHGLTVRDLLWLPPYFRVPASQNQLAPNSVSHIVLTVGRLSASERYKGHDEMLESWPAIVKRVPGAVYWIVGDGDDRARLEDKARQLNIVDSVKFLGTLTGDNLNACYEKCGLFAMPAKSDPYGTPPRGEGFGIVYVEAMAHGKPVIAARDGAPAEFVRDGELGILVNPGDERELAEAVADLLTEPERAQKMGAAGRKWVETELSFEKFCERLRNALSTVSPQNR